MHGILPFQYYILFTDTQCVYNYACKTVTYSITLMLILYVIRTVTCYFNKFIDIRFIIQYFGEITKL
jgi:hypothetical protein